MKKEYMTKYGDKLQNKIEEALTGVHDFSEHYFAEIENHGGSVDDAQPDDFEQVVKFRIDETPFLVCRVRYTSGDLSWWNYYCFDDTSYKSVSVSDGAVASEWDDDLKTRKMIRYFIDKISDAEEEFDIQILSPEDRKYVGAA